MRLAPSSQYLLLTICRPGILLKPILGTLFLAKMMSVNKVLEGKYPAKAHARKVINYIRQSQPDAQGVFYLEGQKTRMIEDNDEPQPFR